MVALDTRTFCQNFPGYRNFPGEMIIIEPGRRSKEKVTRFS